MGGGTGATGRWIAKLLLQKKEKVIALVRPPASRFLEMVEGVDTSGLGVIEETALTLDVAKFQELVEKSSCVISALGHNLSLTGMFLDPLLVRDSVQRVLDAGASKLILMGTVGARLPDEKNTWGEAITLSLLRNVIPPHNDNELAQELLRKSSTDYVVVRPDSLIDSDEISEYELTESPTTTIFSGKPTSRINVAAFMVELATDRLRFEEWNRKSPCIQNKL